MKLKSNLGGHFAGTGTRLAFVEPYEMYKDLKLKPNQVRFPNDPVDDDYDSICKTMSGLVRSYRLEEIK